MSLPAEQRPDPDQLSFVLFGDPSNARNGLAAVVPVLQGVLGVPGPAPDTPYDSLWLIREYDLFADFPDRPWNLLAVANAVAGWVYIHPVYNGVDPTSEPGVLVDAAVNSQGGTDLYVLMPTRQLPLTMPLRQLGVPDRVVDDVDRLLRPVIDSAYDRRGYEPVTARDDVDLDQFELTREEPPADEPVPVSSGAKVKSGNKFSPGMTETAADPEHDDADGESETDSETTDPEETGPDDAEAAA
jgi:hypothetical protein